MNIDWSLFFAMGGHGAFVWGAYGAALALLGAEAILLWRRARAAAGADDPGGGS